MTDDSGKLPRNHLLWMGPLLTLAGTLSYFLVFVRWPALRDFPWVNLPLVLAGFTLSLAALRRPRRRSVFSSVLRGAGLGFSALVAGLFCFYVFYLSSTLPSATAASLQMEQAPDFALEDQHGQVVRLADMRGEQVILVFFRGFW